MNTNLKSVFSIIGVALLLPAFASSQTFTLETLIEKAKQNNPALQMGSLEREVVASDTLIGKHTQNPELNVESGYNIADPAKPKVGVKISQEVQFGTRSRQILLARSHVNSSQELQHAQELEIEFQIRNTYYHWLILHLKKNTLLEVENKWKGIEKTVVEKYKEGRLSQLEQTQAKLNTVRSEQKVKEVEFEINQVKKDLNYLVRNSENIDSIFEIEICTLPPLPKEETLLSWAEVENADIHFLKSEMKTKQFQLDFENAIKNPAFTFSLGYEKETEGNQSIVGGLSLPLPLFNRNQVAISKSGAELKISKSKL